MERAVQNECIIKRKLSRLCKLSLSAVQKVKGKKVEFVSGKKVEFVSGKMGSERERKGATSEAGFCDCLNTANSTVTICHPGVCSGKHLHVVVHYVACSCVQTPHFRPDPALKRN